MPQQTKQREENKKMNGLDNAFFVSSYFGFLPIKAPTITKNDIELTKHCGNSKYYNASEKMAVMRTYLEQDFVSLPHPLAVIYKKPAARKKFGTHELHLFGLHSGVAEATLIRTTLSILSEEGYKNLRVDINCVGDKDSINIYERELTNCVRRLGLDLSDELKQRVKEDIFNLFREETEEALRLREMVPPSLNFLSATNRVYFKEVLEYVEALGIEFRLAPELVGEKNHTSQRERDPIGAHEFWHAYRFENDEVRGYYLSTSEAVQEEIRADNFALGYVKPPIMLQFLNIYCNETEEKEARINNVRKLAGS